MNLIKVLNPDKANELIKSGFKYTLERVDGKDIYVFMNNENIINYIQNNFAKRDFYIDTTMNF